MEADALAIEYKRDYGLARRQAKLTDFVNYPPIEGELSRFGLSLPEKTLRLVRCDLGAGGDVAAVGFEHTASIADGWKGEKG